MTISVKKGFEKYVFKLSNIILIFKGFEIFLWKKDAFDCAGFFFIIITTK